MSVKNCRKNIRISKLPKTFPLHFVTVLFGFIHKTQQVDVKIQHFYSANIDC